jgi:hypothetical protein
MSLLNSLRFKKKIVSEMEVDINVCNGKYKKDSKNANIICESDVLNAIMSLKTKHCEGYDHIPPIFLSCDAPILLKPLSVLFNKIDEQRDNLGQGLSAEINSVPKKEEKI